MGYIKMGLKELEFKDVGFIEMAQDKVPWQSVINMVQTFNETRNFSTN
jgi:hypothetical protein